MTLQEFAALKVGDKIDNHAAFSHGEVTEVTKDGVHVVWGVRSAVERPFVYPVVSTAWMQWSLSDAVQEKTAGNPGAD